MKPVFALGMGAAFTLAAVATWIGCSSDNGGGNDSGVDAASSSSSSSSSSTGAASSSSSSSSSSTGAASSSSSSSSSSSGGHDGGTGDAGDGGGSPGDAGDGGLTDAGDGAANAPTFTQVYADIIAPHCAGCHSMHPDGGAGGGFSVGHLDMSTVDAAYANVIDVPPMGTASPGNPDAAICDTLAADAGSDSGILRVTPFSPSHSLLCRKVGGFLTPPPCGSPMPITGEIPDGGQDAAFAEIQAWINGGAKP